MSYQDAHEQISNNLYGIMTILAFGILVITMILNVAQEKNNSSIVRMLGNYFLIVVLITGWKPLTLATDDAFSQVAASSSSDMDKIMQNVGKSVAVEGSDDWYNVSASIGQFFFELATGTGRIVRWFLHWLQQMMLGLMIVVSPICLSLLSHQATNSTGVKFILGTLGLTLFHIAFNIADYMILLCFDGIWKMAAVGLASGATSATSAVIAGAQFAPACLGAVIMIAIGLFFLVVGIYVGVPVFIYALLRGDNAMSAALQATNTAANTSQLALGGANRGVATKLAGNLGKTGLGKGLSGLKEAGRGIGSLASLLNPKSK